MADLRGFDANQVEPRTAMDPIPAGKYVAMITASEMKPNKAATGKLLELVFTIVEGEYKNRQLWARLNLDNPSEVAMKIAQAELSVYSKDAQIVGLTNDPALYPLAPDAPSAARVVLQRKGEGASATVVLKTSDKPPISFDLTLRVNGQTYGCGSIRNVPIKGGRTYGPNGTSAEVDMVDPKTKTAEVVLTPNPHAVEQCPGVDWIWGEEVVLTNVPLTRYDLPGTNSVPAQ